MKTLNVPARSYDQGLRFVNARRKERGLSPLRKLPAGRRENPYSCPCASACGASITVGYIRWRWGRDTATNVDAMRMGVPRYFVTFFDTHAPAGIVLPVRGLRRK